MRTVYAFFSIIILLQLNASALAQEIELRTVIEQAIASNPGIEIADERLKQSKADLDKSRSVYDLFVQSQAGYEESHQAFTPVQQLQYNGLSELVQNDMFYSVGLRQATPWGFSLNPEISYKQTDYDIEAVPATGNTTVNLNVSVPLFENRGSIRFKESLSAAESGFESAREEYRWTITSQIYKVITLYWRWRGAEEQLRMLEASEDRLNLQLADSEELVNANELPEADLIGIKASLLSIQSSRRKAQNSVQEAFRNLRKEIGIEYEYRDNSTASTSFPAVSAMDNSAISVKRWIEHALMERNDLKSLKRKADGLERGLNVAENALQPKIDLGFDVGYTGFEQDRNGENDIWLQPYLQNIGGANIGVKLNVEFPFQNRSDRAAYTKARSSKKMEEIRIMEKEQQIRLNVRQAAEDVILSRLTVNEAQRVVSLYTEVLENEKLKLKMGNSTIIDVISSEDRLSQAQQKLAEAQTQLALDIVKASYETGTLVRFSPEPEVDFAQLFKIPTIE